MQMLHRVPTIQTQALRRRAVVTWLGATTAICAISASGCNKEGAASAMATPSKQGLSAEGNPNPTADDRCAMCAMRVADNPGWAGAVELHSGATYYGCSVRCTLATAMHSEKFLGVPTTQIRRVRVPDYLHKDKSVDADAAWFVVDSDVRGPMGLTLVPASSERDANTIVERHKGRILRRADVTDAVLFDLKLRSKAS